MTMIAAFLLAAVDGWMTGVIAFATAVLGAVATWFQSKKKTAAEVDKIKADTDMSLFSTAMKYVEELKRDILVIRADLEQSEKECAEYRQKFLELEDQLRNERHRANNALQQLELFKADMEDYKARQEVNLDFLNREIDRLKNLKEQ